jgi:hypothetical protein
MRVSLSKSSLREIFARSPGEEIFLEYVPLGSQVEISVRNGTLREVGSQESRGEL